VPHRAETIDEGWCRDVHARLVNGDPIAPAELAERALQTVQRLVARQQRTTEARALVDQAVVDAFVALIKQPSSFNPAKGSLIPYLVMSAHRDLLNALAKQRRIRARELSTDPVDLEGIAGNSIQEDYEVEELAAARSARLAARMSAILTDPVDRAILDLLCNGERSTAAFAKILGLESLPINEQRKKVKQHKDRVMKCLQRSARRGDL